MKIRPLLAFLFFVFALFGAPARAVEPAIPEGLAASDWLSIREAYEAQRHAVVADEAAPGHYRARNPGQRWMTTFDGRGFTKTPSVGLDGGGWGSAWTWGLDLVSYGRGDHQQVISGTAKVQPSGTRVEYVWSESLTEWYINDQRGFEHGYTLRDRPEGANGPDGMLHFTIAVRGELVPRVSENGRDVAFTSAADGSTTLTYNNLKVFDADGGHLAASFQAITTTSGTHALRLTIDDSNARYPLTIDPIVQQAYLKAFRSPLTGVGTGDEFGASVAVSGDMVVVGAPFEDSSALGINGNGVNNSADGSGAAYLFVRSGNTWTQQAYFKAINTGEGDNFGISVAISGTTVVVGAVNEDSNATGVNGNQADNSAGGSGAAYVYVRTGNIWILQAYLKASNTGEGDNFGISVAISGDTIVVGAKGESSVAAGVNGNQTDNSAASAGAAYVFARSGSTWTQQAYLKASNSGADDLFGHAVAVSGDTVVVGARQEDGDGNGAGNSGAAYVFARPEGGTSWTEQAYLKPSNTEADDEFGWSVAISDDTVVVGAIGEDSNATGVNADGADNNVGQSGAAYVFVRPPGGTTWTQQAYLKASNTGANDFFGTSVAISGDTVVVGARQESSNATGVNGNQADNSAAGAGAAYVFLRSGGGTTWTQEAYLKAFNTGADDEFGLSVAISGDTILIGVNGEDSNATDVNGIGADNSASNSGAAYVFIRPPGGTTWTQQAYVKAANVPITTSNDFFGRVAVSGDTVVIGAAGEDSNATGVNGNGADDSAGSAGAAYVYVRSGTTWIQQAYLKASNTDASDRFGQSVAISGDTVVVGAIHEDGLVPDSGAAYVFVRSGASWSQQAYLKASYAGMDDYFGWSVAVSGDTVVVGANREDSNATGVNGNGADNNATSSGAAYVFVRSGTTWTQQAYLKASNTGRDDEFGTSVAVWGDTVVVGANLEDSNATGVNGNGANNNASSAGAAYVFVRSGTTWTQQAYLKASNTGVGFDQFGVAVAVSGDTVVVGANLEDSNATGVNGDQANSGASDSGAAYVFVRSGTTWTQQAFLKASNTGAGDKFGRSVAISGDKVVVGANDEDSNATGVNGDQANNSAPDSGAAYVFVRSGGGGGGTTWTQQAYLKASNTGAADQFGFYVAVSGDTVVVGAPVEDSHATGVNGNGADNSATDSGAAYVFLLGLPTPASPVASPASVCAGEGVSLSVANSDSGVVIDWFTGSCGGTLIGTGSPLIVNPAATTTYFARARRLSDGNTSDACASVTVVVLDPTDPACSVCPACAADYDQDGGVTGGDLAAFFADYESGEPCADVDQDGGITGGDLGFFFAVFEAGGC